MELATTHHEHVTVIAIAGSVDSLTADTLTAALVEQVGTGRVKLVCDFSAVDYTSSAGLRSLLGALKESRRLGGNLRMASVQPSAWPKCCVRRASVLSAWWAAAVGPCLPR